MANSIAEKSKEVGGWLSTQYPPKACMKQGWKKANHAPLLSSSKPRLLRQTRLQAKPRPATVLAMAKLDLLHPMAKGTKQSSLLQYVAATEHSGQEEMKKRLTNSSASIKDTAPLANKVETISKFDIGTNGKNMSFHHDDLHLDTPNILTDYSVNQDILTTDFSIKEQRLNLECKNLSEVNTLGYPHHNSVNSESLNNATIPTVGSSSNEGNKESVACRILSLKPNDVRSQKRQSDKNSFIVDQRCENNVTPQQEKFVDHYSLSNIDIQTPTFSHTQTQSIITKNICRNSDSSICTITLEFTDDNNDTSDIEIEAKKRKVVSSTSTLDSIGFSNEDDTDRSSSLSKLNKLFLSERSNDVLRDSEIVSKEKYKEMMGTLEFSDIITFPPTGDDGDSVSF